MRTTPAIDALFPSVRRDILGTLLLRPEREWYVRDLASQLALTPSSLQRELARLTSAGILRRRRDGNRVYYQAEPDCPFFPELRGLLAKTAGLVDVLRDLLNPMIDRIAVAFVYGSVAQAAETTSSDIDLMVIGAAGRFDLTPILRKAEERLGRPVNLSLYKPTEFAKKLAADNHFLGTVIDKEKIFVVGGTDELERVGTAKTRHR